MQQNCSASKFDLDEIVWARVIGYPFWPGQVSCIYEKTTPNGLKYHEYVVNFFKDVSHAILREKHILNYAEHRDTCAKVKYRGLAVAIQLADAALQNQRRVKQVKRAEPVDENSIELQIILNCLTFQSTNITYLWNKLTELVTKLEHQGHSILGSKSDKIFKCILKLLRSREKLLNEECPDLFVGTLIKRMDAIVMNPIENHFCQDTQSEEPVAVPYKLVCEETEEEPVPRQKFRGSAFTPISEAYDWDRMDALKHPKHQLERKPTINSSRSFNPIVLQQTN